MYAIRSYYVAEDGPMGLDMVQQGKFDVILCDIKMPGMDGLEVLAGLTEQCPEVPVIMISGHGNIDTAVEAIKAGAYDFIQKPLDLNRLLVTLKNALERSDLVGETKRLCKKISRKYTIVGESEPIQKVKAMIRITSYNVCYTKLLRS